MKKVLLGLIIGVGVALPASALAIRATTGYPDANNIIQFNCQGQWHDAPFDCNRVAVFDDQDNKCYISYDVRGAQSSISCVKQQ